MKQHITSKQLNELSEKGKSKLIDWQKKRGYKIGDVSCDPHWDEKKKKWFYDIWAYSSEDEDWRQGQFDRLRQPVRFYAHYSLPLLSIGQMIEFLGDEWFTYIALQNKDDLKQFMVAKPDALCDALWEAVKEVLNDN